MTTIASQLTSLTIVYTTVYSDADQNKHHSSASLAFVWGIHRGSVNSPHKWPVTRKMLPFDDVIMCKTHHTCPELWFVTSLFHISIHQGYFIETRALIPEPPKQPWNIWVEISHESITYNHVYILRCKRSICQWHSHSSLTLNKQGSPLQLVYENPEVPEFSGPDRWLDIVRRAPYTVPEVFSGTCQILPLKPSYHTYSTASKVYHRNYIEGFLSVILTRFFEFAFPSLHLIRFWFTVSWTMAWLFQWQSDNSEGYR